MERTKKLFEIEFSLQAQKMKNKIQVSLILIIFLIGKKPFIWLLGAPIIFLSLSNAHAKNLPNCIKSNKNTICIGEAENSYGESVYHLYVNNRKYPEISYYDNATIHKVDSKRFKIFSSFSSQGNTGITTTLSLKNGKPFIERINTVIRLNESPAGAIEKCQVKLNSYFIKNINIYVDELIFDLTKSERQKKSAKTVNAATQKLL